MTVGALSFLQHPFFAATDPKLSRLVRVSVPFPEWLNPFWSDGVTIRAASIPGDVDHSKSYVARELLLGADFRGIDLSAYDREGGDKR